MVYNPLSQPPTRDVLQQEDDKIGPQWELWFNQLRALQRSMTGYEFAVTATGIGSQTVREYTVNLSAPVPSDAFVLMRAPASFATTLLLDTARPTATGALSFRIYNRNMGSVAVAATDYAALVIRGV
jgi:hypothetical protein